MRKKSKDSPLLSSKPWDNKDYIYSICIFLFSIVLFYIISPQMLHADFTVPFENAHDGLASSIMFRTIAEQGISLHEPHLSAWVGHSYDTFPFSDKVIFLIARFLGLFTTQPGILFNIMYILSFGLVGLCGYIASRVYLSRFSSIFISILFNFIPYHQMRIDHAQLMFYFSVPLLIVLCVQMIENKIKVTKNKKFVLAIITAVICANTGLYYAFFSCFFLLACLIIIFINNFQKGEKWNSKLLAPTIILSITIILVFVNILPSLSVFHPDSKSSVSARHWIGSEVYGLKIIQLLLPRIDHRIDKFSAVTTEYFTKTINNETRTAALGFLASGGFLALIAATFVRNKKSRFIQILSSFNILAILLAIVGGIGTIFSFFITPIVRCYNRLSIYIAFISFLAIGYFIDWFIKRTKNKTLVYIISLSVFIIALFDQTVPMALNIPAEDSFREYKNFVAEIEEVEEENAKIFMLPYLSWPNQIPVGKMTIPYEHMRPLQHSKDLIWGYGYEIHTDPDLVYKHLAQLPYAELAKVLSRIGYEGIYINTAGYSDEEMDQLRQELDYYVTEPPIVSEEKNLIYYNLTDKDIKEEQKENTDNYILSILNNDEFSFKNGFYETQISEDGVPFHWMESEGKIRIINGLNNPVSLQISFKAIPSNENGEGEIVISGLANKKVTGKDLVESVILDVDLSPNSSQFIYLSSTFESPVGNIEEGKEKINIIISDYKIRYK